MPSADRASMAACAAAASSSGNVCPITDRSRPSAASASALRDSSGGETDLAADAVEDDVHRLHGVRPARHGVVRHRVGSELVGECQLGRRAGGRDDTGACGAGELNEQGADAARGGFDEDGLTRRDRRALQEPQRRAAVGQERDRLGRRQLGWDRDERLGRGGDPIGEPPLPPVLATTRVPMRAGSPSGPTAITRPPTPLPGIAGSAAASR